jgi:hypothetical protein
MAFGDPPSSSPYFRTDAFLDCKAVSREGIAGFLDAPLEERIRLYVSWKRQELEASLPADHRICPRCHVEFKVYDNDWGRAGFCSHACHQAAMKSGRKPG